jgi:signal transduction histidine kinase
MTEENNSAIVIDWFVDTNNVHIEICDNGTGINNADNLFVPFYTTKKQGSGIGLTLSRQIVLNHGGDLNLRNMPGEKGAKATILLPSGNSI